MVVATAENSVGKKVSYYTKKLRGLSASKLYRPSDHRLSMKLVQLQLIEGVVWSAQRIPTAVISFF
jgi:hypothetical protein